MCIFNPEFAGSGCVYSVESKILEGSAVSFGYKNFLASFGDRSAAQDCRQEDLIASHRSHGIPLPLTPFSHGSGVLPLQIGACSESGKAATSCRPMKIIRSATDHSFERLNKGRQKHR
jgi:hypothetical protein